MCMCPSVRFVRLSRFCPDDIFGISESFVTKCRTVLHHDGPGSRAKTTLCYFQGQTENMTSNLAWLYIFISQVVQQKKKKKKKKWGGGGGGGTKMVSLRQMFTVSVTVRPEL